MGNKRTTCVVSFACWLVCHLEKGRILGGLVKDITVLYLQIFNTKVIFVSKSQPRVWYNMRFHIQGPHGANLGGLQLLSLLLGILSFGNKSNVHRDQRTIDK